MRQFVAFSKKEFVESVATFRLYILLVVFLFLGIMGPLMAVLTPALLEMLAADETAGIIIIMPDPTYVDAWREFFSGFALMGMLAIAVMFSGLMANELSRGTLVNLLTKGLKRHTVILAKFFSASTLWTAAIVLAVGVSYMYTAFYFDTEPIPHFLLVFGAPWLFGMFMIALSVFGGTLFGSFYGSLSVCIGVFFVLIFAGNVPAINRFSPASLASGTLGIIMRTAEAVDFVPAIIVCAVSIVVLIVGAIWVFNRKTV